MTTSIKRVASLQQGHPSGTVLGRLSAGTGATEYIDIADLVQASAATGAAGSGGASSGALPPSGVTAGSYTLTDLTVNAQGIITAASSGSAPVSALALISTLTASASADLHWTGLATQTSWRLVGRLIVPTTVNHGVGLVVGTGAGPTYITTGYHVTVNGRTDANAAFGAGALNNANVSLDVGDCGGAPGNSFDVVLLTDNATFLTVAGSGLYKNNAGNIGTTNIGASIAIAAPITAIKLIMDNAGTLASGTASLYSLSS